MSEIISTIKRDKYGFFVARVEVWQGSEMIEVRERNCVSLTKANRFIRDTSKKIRESKE